MPTTTSPLQRSTLLELTKSVAIDAGDTQRAFQEICRSAALALDVARVSIWSYDRAREAIVCEALFEREHDRHSSGLVLHQRDFPAYFAYLREERVLAADDAHIDPATSEFSQVYLAPLGIQSMLDAPIRWQGALWGVVCHEHAGYTRRWTIADQVFGASMADFAARALAAAERAEAQQALAALNENLEALVETRTRDLTQALEELRTTQARLVEREKLASLGSLVAGVAHEVNTPLGVAVTAASAWHELLETLRAAFAGNQVRRSDLGRFLERSQQLSGVLTVNLARAADLVKSFQQTAVRQSTRERETFSLRDALSDAVESLRPEWKRHGVEVVVGGDPGVVLHAAPGFVFQLVSNLVVNAIRHAFPDGRAGNVRFEVEPEGEREARIRYDDDGAGASAEVVSRMWEPFFTTRRGTGGSGLGLNIVWNLVVGDLGGSVDVVSAPGEGMHIVFRIPRMPLSHAEMSRS